MNINNCSVCSKTLKPIFSLGLQPLANKYPKIIGDFEREIRHEMVVHYCDECNYVSLPCDEDRSIFFEDYYYLSSVNQELVAHFEDLAEQISRRKPSFVLDVGSNDGVLLRPLQARNLKCVGVDPSENVSKIANNAGLETFVGFFDSLTAKAIEVKHGKPDLICASSVFTHLQNPREFFETANDLLADNGEILIEVEYLDKIVETLGFERFYFDRPHYYSLKSLHKLAEGAGFELIDFSIVNTHGGSLRALFGRSGSTDRSSVLEAAMASEDKSLSRQAIEEKFLLFKSACRDLKEHLHEFRNQGLRLAAYGCPARFSTITNFSGIDSDLLSYVVDDSFLKQNRFSPGMHIPIVPYKADEVVDIFIVFSYEYINSIKNKVALESVKFFRPVPFQQL